MAPIAKWDVSSAVKSISLSPDGTRVVCGSDDGYVRIWDMWLGTLVLGPLKGHTRRVESVAFSRDDTLVASGSDDGTVRIWNAYTGTPFGDPLEGHTHSVCSVAFSPDSTLIVSGSYDNTIRLWDASTGAPIGSPITEHNNVVSSVAFSSNSARVVSGSWDRTIRIWDTRTRAPVGKPLKGHSRSVYSVAFSPDDTRIASGSWDHTIRIWDVRTGVPIGKPLKGHTGSVSSVAFSSDSTRIVSGSFDDTIRVWDAHTGAPVGKLLKGHTGIVNSVAFSPDSTQVISGALDHTICVWETQERIDAVSGRMSTEELFAILVRHGCADLSLSIGPTQYSLSAIASGGFGDVWQGRLTSGVLVAIKQLRYHIFTEGEEKGMKRVAREIHHWSKARHENIQELLGIVMFQDRLGMVSLWMHNGNLRQYIERNPTVDRYPLCIQVAKGVAYLHGIGMVHGDIKAINILVSADGIVKISDFDCSLLSENSLRFSQTTKGGGGAPRWMAPELLLYWGDEDDEGPTVTRNKKTDVYALGMTMLEIISGKVPYSQFQHDVAVMLALERREPPRCPNELSAPNKRGTRMWELLLRCWDQDPNARPDAATVLEYLQHVVMGAASTD